MIWYDMIRYATLRYIYIKKCISLCVFGSSTPKYIGSPRIWAVACPEFCILELGLWTTSARALLGNSSCPSACSPTSQSPLFAHLSLSPFPLPSGTGFYQNTICVVKSRFPSPTICPPRLRYETQCPRLMTYLCGCSRSSRANLKSLWWKSNLAKASLMGS